MIKVILMLVISSTIAFSNTTKTYTTTDSFGNTITKTSNSNKKKICKKDNFGNEVCKIY